MKKFFLVLFSLVLLALIISYFIPSVQKNQVFVGSTLENIVSSTFQPANWIKWNAPVKQAWLKDSSSVFFREDTVRHVNTIDMPGKKIRISRVNYLLYEVEETKGSKHSSFIYSIVPYVGENKEPRSHHNSLIAYARDSRLFYKILPFLKPESFADRTISALKSYLENTVLFYGLPIQLKEPSDTLFLTQQETLANRENVFKKLPWLFNELDSFARAHQANPKSIKNVSFDFLPGDSIRVMAGIHIDRIIEGDYLVNCRLMPPNQLLVAGTYEGPFSERRSAYKAMNKYLVDHQLVKGSAVYEKYLSPLPVSDSSIIKIELTYPLRSLITQ